MERRKTIARKIDGLLIPRSPLPRRLAFALHDSVEHLFRNVEEEQELRVSEMGPTIARGERVAKTTKVPSPNKMAAEGEMRHWVCVDVREALHLRRGRDWQPATIAAAILHCSGSCGVIRRGFGRRFGAPPKRQVNLAILLFWDEDAIPPSV
jgi:hypothetical protein